MAWCRDRVAHDHGQPASDPRAGRVVAPPAGGGQRAFVRWSRTVLPRFGQGPGEIRDAGRSCHRRAERHGSGRAARLLARRLLSDYVGVRRSRNAWAPRRAARATWAPQAHPGRDRVHRIFRSDVIRRATRIEGRGTFWRELASPHRREGAPLSRRFWPIGEAAQADYEALREAVLSGQAVQSLTAARFARRGLAGLIAWPAADSGDLERSIRSIMNTETGDHEHLLAW